MTTQIALRPNWVLSTSAAISKKLYMRLETRYN